MKLSSAAGAEKKKARGVRDPLRDLPAAGSERSGRGGPRRGLGRGAARRPYAHVDSTESGQTLQGSFSAVSKRNFARKYAFESSRRELHNALLCTALQSQMFAKLFAKFCKF